MPRNATRAKHSALPHAESRGADPPTGADRTPLRGSTPDPARLAPRSSSVVAGVARSLWPSRVAPLTPPVQLALSSLVETGGTTLRSLLQRQAQWGEWDFFSYAPSIGEDIMWISLLARVRAAAEAPPELDALDGLRILAEVHGKGTEQTVATRILPDVLALKELLGGRCEVKIVSMVRHPVDLYLSWHQHWVSGLVPLCMW